MIFAISTGSFFTLCHGDACIEGYLRRWLGLIVAVLTLILCAVRPAIRTITLCRGGPVGNSLIS